MKEGAVTLNEDDIILYSNSRFATMVGLPLSQVLGFPLSRFIPDECAENLNDYWGPPGILTVRAKYF